jgi:putative peptidoglycan lipid II flippase
LKPSSQIRNSFVLFFGQLLIKGNSFIKQILLAFYFGVTGDVDLLLISQIIPTILSSMIAGGAGEILVTYKDENENTNFISAYVFIIALVTLVSGLIYLFFIPSIISFYGVLNSQKELFWNLSILFIISRIPLAFVSSLQHLLFVKNKYNYFVISSLISELIGLLAIVLFVDSYGILSFGFALIVTPVINALFFIYAVEIDFFVLFKLEVWVMQKKRLQKILKQTFNLSIQTLINHLSTFWERTLSFKYLNTGFLSALNYSKNLSDYPKMAMLSSAMTTTYAEQVKRKNTSDESYVAYTNRMFNLFTEASAVVQILSLIFGPVILIVILNHGAFDDKAVNTTFSIYQLISLSFIPSLMIGFLSRTMYIEEKYRQLTFTILIKFFVELLLMFVFIKTFSLAIPFAIVIGRWFITIAIVEMLIRNNKQILNRLRFFKILLVAIPISLLVYFVNESIIANILKLNTLTILLYYLPFFLLTAIGFIWFMQKRLEINILQKLFKRFKNGQ